jgi:D-3-phosphoglycerate dehydrogenase
VTSARPIVLKTDPPFVAFSDPHRALLQDAGLQLVERSCPTEEELIAHAQDADALMVIAEPITDRVLAALPKLRVVARFGVGLDNVDVTAATRRGIPVTYVPGGSVPEVSDHALAMLLALSRGLVPLNAAVHRSSWAMPPELAPLRRLRDQTVGVIGAGRIGSAFAAKVRPLVARVLVCDPVVPEDTLRERGYEPARLDELLAASDHVSVHTFLAPETRHLVGARELSLMKPTATLINVSRGPIVDEAALVEALREGRLGGAGLDVLEHEPPEPGDPLLRLPNVLLSPHAAHSSVESADDILRTVVEDVIAVLDGRAPQFPANSVTAA